MGNRYDAPGSCKVAQIRAWQRWLIWTYAMLTVSEHPELQVGHPIVFFDGVCGLCDRAVKRLLKMDGRRVLRFAPLQGETAHELLAAQDTQDLKSMIVYDGRGAARYSTAVVRILWHVGGFWRFLSYCLWLIPKPIRDFGYRFVAHRRYRWFGKTEACRLPQPGERELFLP